MVTHTGVDEGVRMWLNSRRGRSCREDFKHHSHFAQHQRDTACFLLDYTDLITEGHEEHLSWINLTQQVNKLSHCLISGIRKELQFYPIELLLMPSPWRFLVASTSLPLTAGWGWNLSVYVGLFTVLLVLMGLLLWMLLKQLRNSVGNSTLQLHLGSRRHRVSWERNIMDKDEKRDFAYSFDFWSCWTMKDVTANTVPGMDERMKNCIEDF